MCWLTESLKWPNFRNTNNYGIKELLFFSHSYFFSLLNSFLGRIILNGKDSL